MKFENILKFEQKKLKNALYNVLRTSNYNPVIKDGFVFAQGTVPVLLVAHLDTVHDKPVKEICYSRDGNIIMSPQGIGGDDRCGVYMILELIKTLHCSVLFCEDEEIGAIGASKFIKSRIRPKNINYIIELDRRGSNDAVFYDCENLDFIIFVESFGFEEAYGSFSDISVLAPGLGIAAVNISSGYYDAHTRHEHINIREMKMNIERLKEMIVADTEQFIYIEPVKPIKVISTQPYIYKGGTTSALKLGEYTKKGGETETYKTPGKVSKPKIDYNYERNYFGDYNVLDLMMITERMGYVYNTITDEVNEWDNFYLDERGNLYIEDIEGMAFPVYSYEARNHEGGFIRYDYTKTEPVVVA